MLSRTVGEHFIFFLILLDIEHPEFVFVIKEGILELHQVGFNILEYIRWSLEMSQFESLDMMFL